MTTTVKEGQAPRYKVVGTRPIRHDGIDKVIGAAKYGADTQLAGMLHGKVLRSPYAHARIRSIDTAKAEALPGVMAVVTAKDFPIIADEIIDLAETQGNSRLMAEHVMASEKALYQGHAVAAVAATSPHIAEIALGLIEIDYEVLEPVLSVQHAMREDAPVIHDNLTTHFKLERFGRGDDTGVHGNVASHIQHKLGDVEQGFKEADLVIEREFNTGTVHQGYIEPHASTASWAGDGRLTVWTCTQGSFAIRSSTAAICGVPEDQVRVIPTEIGGGFGAKITTYLEPLAAILSKKTARPVKMVMSRKDVFEGTGPTSATNMRTKIGVKNNGKITAAHVWMAFEAGAFPGSPVGGGTLCATGPYNIENLLVDGYDVVVNKQKVQAYRAPGQPQGAFAVEPLLDELADMLGMDPIELRLRNVAKEGDRMPNGVAHPKFGTKELEEAMKDHPHYNAPLTGPHQGRGVAVGYRWQAGQMSAATIAVNSNGTINLITGSVDIGGSRTAVAMQAAEVLGIAAEDVAAHGGGYRHHWLHCRHRRQPHRLRHRLGRHPGGRGGDTPDGSPGGPDLGGARGGRSLRRRCVHLHQESRGQFHFQGAGRPDDADRGADYDFGLGGVHRRGADHRREHCGRRGRPGNGQGGHSAFHRLSGRGHAGSSRLRRRPDTRRYRTGHRLGVE